MKRVFSLHQLAHSHISLISDESVIDRGDLYG